MENKKTSGDTYLTEQNTESAPRDDRFADPQTDEDPRTSDEGMTSIGGYDINADATPAETPGVRHEGDEEVVATPASVNTALKDDIMNSGA